MPKPFHELRERLLRAGMAPRHVRRYLSELADHLADLKAEEERAGLNRTDAETAALARLGGIDDLAIDGEVHEVFELLLAESPADEADLDRRLLAALGEVLFVEREAQLSVFEDEVLSGVVVSAARRVHDEKSRQRWARRGSSGSYGRFLPCRS